MEIGTLQDTVIDASVSKGLKIVSHEGELTLKHIPFLLIVLGVGIINVLPQLESSLKKFRPLLFEPEEPRLHLYIFLHIEFV